MLAKRLVAPENDQKSALPMIRSHRQPGKELPSKQVTSDIMKRCVHVSFLYLELDSLTRMTPHGYHSSSVSCVSQR